MGLLFPQQSFDLCQWPFSKASQLKFRCLTRSGLKTSEQIMEHIVDVDILLMVQKSGDHPLRHCSSSHVCTTGFLHPRCCRMSEASTVSIVFSGVLMI